MSPGSRNRPLRVALLLHLAPRKLGSMEAWLQGLALRLRERGHSVTVFCRDPIHPDIARSLQRAGVSHESLDRLTAHPLRGVLRLRGFDVLHFNFVSPIGRCAFLGFCAWPARVLIVDHISRAGTDPTAASERRKSGGSMLRRWKRSVLAALARRRLTGISAVSDYVRRETQRAMKLPEDRIMTIYNGVDTNRFRPNGRPDLPRNTFAITCVANLIPAKGIDHLLAAFAAIDDRSAVLTIVGDGPDRESLERLAVELGIERRARFLGLRDDVDELLRDSDLFVHPAVWGEAFGLTITEAMASGCPVVASNVGGIPELIEDGVTGLLVPPADQDALREAIERLIGDQDLRRRLSANARDLVMSRFSLNECVEAHVEWCEAAG